MARRAIDSHAGVISISLWANSNTPFPAFLDSPIVEIANVNSADDFALRKFNDCDGILAGPDTVGAVLAKIGDINAIVFCGVVPHLLNLSRRARTFKNAKLAFCLLFCLFDDTVRNRHRRLGCGVRRGGGTLRVDEWRTLPWHWRPCWGLCHRVKSHQHDKSDKAQDRNKMNKYAKDFRDDHDPPRERRDRSVTTMPNGLVYLSSRETTVGTETIDR